MYIGSYMSLVNAPAAGRRGRVEAHHIRRPWRRLRAVRGLPRLLLRAPSAMIVGRTPPRRRRDCDGNVALQLREQLALAVRGPRVQAAPLRLFAELTLRERRGVQARENTRPFFGRVAS